MKKTGILIAAAALMLLPCFAACGKLPYEEGTFEAASAVNSVSIEARDRRVEIALADGDRVKLEYYRNEKEYYDITESDGALSVTLKYDKEWTDYIGAGGDRDKQVIRVYIPKDGLERLSVSTTGRDVLLDGISAEEITLSTNNGDIALQSVAAGSSLTAAAKNGSVKGSIVGSYDVFQMDISVKKGNSNIMSKSGGEKFLKIDVNNGDIEINFTT